MDAGQAMYELNKLQEENTHLRKALSFALSAMEISVTGCFDPVENREYWMDFVTRMKEYYET